jgi:hypothetical protein
MYDENPVDVLKGNSGSMGFLVSSDAHRRLQVALRSLTITLQNTMFSSIVASFIETYKVSRG